MSRLPVQTVTKIPDSPGGRVLGDALALHGRLHDPMRWRGMAVLDIPEYPSVLYRGRRRWRVRQRIREAENEGIYCELVTDQSQRRALLEISRQVEREHPDVVYRQANPDNSELLEHEFWLVARDKGGEPMLLAVTPIAGDWAVLRYFRTLGHTDTHGHARYLATREVVAELAARGVRHILDNSPPSVQTPGARYFQRLFGYRLVRIKYDKRA